MTHEQPATLSNISSTPRRNIPFSTRTDVCRNVLVPSPAVVGSAATTARVVNFGTYDVGRVQLWQIGSHRPNVTCGARGGIEF